AAADGGIAVHARQFEGAWAYLELIAAAAGIDDPLDERVVEAYWLGNELLELLDPDQFPGLLRDRLPEQPGAVWAPGHAHHGYHVFAVYPWVGLLARTGRTEPALGILDSCRIRWGEVVAVDADRVRVQVRPLTLHDGRLELGDPVEQTVALLHGGLSLLESSLAPEPGDTVAMHWDWVCDVLRPEQAEQLHERTSDQLGRTNAALVASR
ncbi:MAG: DUF6390 family protein, partial [Actinomycetota bacterium]|nr:DUF6390 family protein [Actinomycetota bacterium]